MKCIVSDLDGTLLSMNKNISDENMKAIRLAQAKGIEFMIATGREYSSAKAIMDTYGIEADTVLMNGAQHRDHEGNIRKNIALPHSAWHAIYGLLNKHNVGAILNYATQSFAISGDMDLQERLAKRFQHLPEKENKILTELLSEGYWQTLIELHSLHDLKAVGEEILKIEAFGFEGNAFENLLQDLTQIPQLSIIPYGSHSMEITFESAQKGIMLERVLADKGYHPDEVMVLGDGLNDVSMFERFHYSIAMENAIQQVKDSANYVTRKNEEHGVAHAIYKYALGL